MGLFDIFKKKQSNVQIAWEVTTNSDKEYNPWAKNDIPVNDNYAIAAFIWISEHGAKVGHTNDDYARYFNYRYGVCDPIKYHKHVISDGYLIEAAPEIALEKLKVEHLKSILSNAGLPSKGKKADLISRITDNVNVESLNLEKYYVPSEKGVEHLRKYEYVFDLPRYSISFEEFDAYKKICADNAKPNDIIWQILNSRFNHYNMNGSFGSARNEILNMAMLLKNEEKFVDALYRYALVLYYDINGCGVVANGSMSENPKDVTLAPGIIEQIRELKEHYDERIVNRCYDRYKLPHSYIGKGNFEKLLFDIFEDKAIDLTDYIDA